MAVLDRLKLRLDIKDDKKDPLLTELLEEAKDSILDHTKRSVFIDALIPLQLKQAIYLYNALGSEGESSRSEGGISVSYQTDIPESIKSRLNAYRVLKGAKVANAGKI